MQKYDGKKKEIKQAEAKLFGDKYHAEDQQLSTSDDDTHPLEIQFTVEEILMMTDKQQTIYFEKIQTDGTLISKALEEAIART